MGCVDTVSFGLTTGKFVQLLSTNTCVVTSRVHYGAVFSLSIGDHSARDIYRLRVNTTNVI